MQMALAKKKQNEIQISTWRANLLNKCEKQKF